MCVLCIVTYLKGEPVDTHRGVHAKTERVALARMDASAHGAGGA